MLHLNSISIVVLITIILIVVISKLLETTKSVKKNKILQVNQIFDSKHLSIVIIVFLIGAIIRVWKFGEIPLGFNQDGAMGAVDALALANYLTDRFGMWLPVHFTAWGFGQMSVLLSYLTVPWIWFFDLNRFTARLPILLISLGGMISVYFLSKRIFNKHVALYIFIFCAINPWHIMQSRWALDCNLLPHFLLFSFHSMILGLQKHKRYMYLSMILFGLTMYTYGIAWYSVPLILIILSMYFLKNKYLRWKDWILYVFVYFGVSFPIFGVMIVNIFKLDSIRTPFFTIPFFPNSQRTGDLLFFSSNFLEQCKSNLQSLLNVAILQKPDLPWNTIPEFGALYLFSIPILILGLIAFLFRIRTSQNTLQIQGFMLLSTWLIVSFLSGLLINNVNVNRLNIIFYPLIILCGFGISILAEKRKIFSILVLSVYFIGFVTFSNSYFGSHAQKIGNAFFHGFGESMEYVKRYEYDRIFITNWTQTQNSNWVSEPLALFHHQIDALYFQGKANAYNKQGRKLLPYQERYRYVSMNTLTIDPNQSAVYIVFKDEKHLFPSKYFDQIVFGNYVAVVPKIVNHKN